MLKAKSKSNGGLTLLDHTRHVVIALEKMATALEFDAVLARKAGILHDLGKGHPFFQTMIAKKDADEDTSIDVFMDEPHRHEISSLLFLPLFPKTEWETLIDLVVAHHKSVKWDAKNRGLLDFVEERYGADWTFNRHLEDESQTWEKWSQQVLQEVLPYFGLEVKTIDRVQARQAFDAAVTHCQTKPNGWSAFKGLLISADHFASHFGEDVITKVASLYQVPDLSYYNRQSKLHPLSLEKADAPHCHTLLFAPTGAGKTDFLLRRCKGRVFYVLPFQASINAMFNRIDANLNHEEGNAQKARRPQNQQYDVRHLHAASTFLKADHRDSTTKDDEIQLQRHPGAAIKILTPHQLAALAFGTNGHEAMALDVSGCDIILDEVHVYADFTQSMVIEITKALVRLGCRVHIGSATIPTDLANQLIEVLGGSKEVLIKSLPDTILKTFDRHVIHKHPNKSQEQVLIQEALVQNSKILVVSNAVRIAQARFEAYCTNPRFKDVPKLLVHSRYKRRDRAALEKNIQVFSDGNMPCIVCTTQVVEVSLDINFDCMFTDAAPLDALIQRFGRVNRKRTIETIGKQKPIHVFAPEQSTLPYKKNIVELSYEVLNEGLLAETKVQALIDQVYRQVLIPPIDLHAIYKEGSYTLKELEHRAKSVLRDQLDIDTIACIVESDRDYYQEWKNKDRFELEIPIPVMVMIKHLKKLEQLKTGHYPFIVPDDWYHPIYGLKLPDTYNDGGVFL